MRIYSSAFVQQETGDLLGYELAIRLRSNSNVDALLYVYEGAASDGIPLPGHIAGKTLAIKGNWGEHLVEYPSKKKIVQTHLVEIDGTLNSALFVGKIKIGDLGTPDPARLRRVDHIWTCKR